MERVRMRDNPAEPLIQTDPSLATQNGGEVEDQAWPSPPPPTTNPQHTKKPQFPGFESPCFIRIGILTLTCAITYPAFYALTFVAKDRSLFIVRLIVAIWCSGIGLALGYTLLKIGARHLEAASEFTSVGYRDILSLSLEQPGPR